MFDIKPTKPPLLKYLEGIYLEQRLQNFNLSSPYELAQIEPSFLTQLASLPCAQPIEESSDESDNEADDENTRLIVHSSSIRKADIFFNGATFVLAALSASVYWYGAQQAGERYSKILPGTSFFFKWITPTCTIITNVMFNWESFLELWEKQTDPYNAIINFWPSSFRDGMKKLLAIVSSAATIAPFFFIGFKGDLLQKTLVVISALLSLFVFYQGALDFYGSFHYPFIQRLRWTLRCSSKNYEFAALKSLLMNRLKAQDAWFYTASSAARDKFMLAMSEAITIEEKLEIILFSDQYFSENLDESSLLRFIKFFLFSGFGLPGILVMAQNFGHVVEIVQGIIALQIPIFAVIILSLILVFGNLIPSLGFSFSGMMNFNFIDLVQKIFFCNQPQMQRILMGSCFSMSSFLLGFMFTVLRCSYIFSGWSNDEVNYQGLKYVLEGEAQNLPFIDIALMTFIFGLCCNVSGAIIFNGVQCEFLFRKKMEERILLIGNTSDKRQVQFQIEFRKMLKALEIAPSSEIAALVSYEKSIDTFANFFRKKLNAGKSDAKQNLLDNAYIV